MNYNESSAIETIHEMMADACSELFRQFGLKAERSEQPVSNVTTCSLISGSGEGLKLNVFFQPDIAVLTDGHPTKNPDVSQAEAEDWCCEFNNQLMGRLKTKLLERSCEINLGLPSLIVGEGIRAAKSQEAVVLSQRFETDFGGLELTTFMRLDPEFVLLDEKAGAMAAQGVMREGEVSLF
jgi:CheY-specific phosphatase CheX